MDSYIDKIKAITTMILLLIVCYLGMFNHNYPIILFCTTLALVLILLWILVIDKRMANYTKLPSKLKVKTIIFEVLNLIFVLIFIYSTTINTANVILDNMYLVFKVMLGIFCLMGAWIALIDDVEPKEKE